MFVFVFAGCIMLLAMLSNISDRLTRIEKSLKSIKQFNLRQELYYKKGQR